VHGAGDIQRAAEPGYFTARRKRPLPVAADVRRRTRFADGTIRLLTSAATAPEKYPGEADEQAAAAVPLDGEVNGRLGELTNRSG